jgi:serine/threonine-protein kinase
MIDIGSQVGEYVVERRLGKGSTARVFSAKNNQNNQVVAIKAFQPELMDNQGLVSIFEEEGNIGLQVKHTNIVQTLAVGRIENQPYIIFEFVHGVNLGTHLNVTKGSLPEEQCLHLMRQMAQALRHLRMKGIVHQDVKPDNIIVDTFGHAKLTDLGFARSINGRIDWTGLRVGTPNYMSPEQADGTKPVDSRSDLYSLGATIYHAATGTQPFVSEDEGEVLEMQKHKKPDPAWSRNPDLSRPFCNILHKLLEKEPIRRFQQSEEILMALRDLKIEAVPPVVTASRVV